MDDVPSSPTAPGPVDEADELDLVISGIQRRRDGHFLVVNSNDEIVLSLTERQMMICLAIASADGEMMRSGLRDVVFPNRPRMRLKHPVRERGKKIYSAPVPMSPSQRASLCRTIRRLESLGLLETYGSQEVEPTEAAYAIFEWVGGHPEILGEDQDLLMWLEAD